MSGRHRGGLTEQDDRRTFSTPDFSPVRIARRCNEPLQRLHPRRDEHEAVETARDAGLLSTWLNPGVTAIIYYEARAGCCPAAIGE
jgi:hypothetical protein